MRLNKIKKLNNGNNINKLIIKIYNFNNKINTLNKFKFIMF